MTDDHSPADPIQVADFIKANKLSPVIAGEAIGNGGEGVIYTLKSGMIFKLNRAECIMIGEPRWGIKQP